jgi:hypothetical protein
MAMSVVLVMAAVIFTRNLRALQTADSGVRRRNLVIFGVRPGTSGYDPSRLLRFYFDLEQLVAATPGITGAGLTWMRPMNIGGRWERVRLAGGVRNQARLARLFCLIPKTWALTAPYPNSQADTTPRRKCGLKLGSG